MLTQELKRNPSEGPLLLNMSITSNVTNQTQEGGEEAQIGDLEKVME